MPQSKTGRFYGVGIGPGDPELMTIKAKRILSLVPVIFVPQKNEKDSSFAGRILSQAIEGIEGKLVPLVFPMHREAAALEQRWQLAAAQIWEKLKAGLDGAFVTEGDPLLYGSFIYVFERLKAAHPEIEIEVIPGISSINAAAAAAMIPLASQDEKVAILPATGPEEGLRQALQTFDTIILIKVHSVFGKVLTILREMRLVEGSIFISRCTTKDEEIVRDIANLEGQKLDYFSLLIVKRQK